MTNTTILVSLYKGLTYKLCYNFPLLSGYYCTTQVGYENYALLSWIAAFVLYPLNTMKVRSQLTASTLTTVNAKTGFVFSAAWRGALPFVLLNALVGYSLRPLFSGEKLARLDGEVK